MRRKPGVHLSAEGISLANQIGRTMGEFDRVVTSRLPRAAETAVAMGYAIDSDVEELGVLPEVLASASGWPADFPTIAGNARRSRDLTEFAEAQAGIWRAIFDGLPNGQSRVLLISHGAIMELGLLAAAGWPEDVQFGGVFGYCEGFRLTYEGSRCVASRALRLPEDRRLVEN